MNYKTNKNDMEVNDEVRQLSTWYPTNGQECVLTGWNSLDKITGGLRNGQVVVVSGYSNMGKTTFVIMGQSENSVASNKPMHTVLLI